eukprot:307429-Pelagomonas_calceolata.AAC.7
MPCLLKLGNLEPERMQHFNQRMTLCTGNKKVIFGRLREVWDSSKSVLWSKEGHEQGQSPKGC